MPDRHSISVWQEPIHKQFGKTAVLTDRAVRVIGKSRHFPIASTVG